MPGSDLAERARQVLRANDAGRWTKPSPAQYPHQWNWDSGFASLGWATFDSQRAALEIESMLGARWTDGMVPHVHYDHRHLARRLDTVHVGPAQRPTGKDYDSLLALAELLDGCDYDLDRYREHSPFCVHDVLIDALWYRAARAVNRIASAVQEEPPFSEAELEEYAAAFHSLHWSEEAGTWFDVDLLTGRQLTAPTAAGLASLAGGLASHEQAERAWTAYLETTPGLLPVPTAAPGPAFEPERHWRGPVWLIVDWLVAEGLEAAGLQDPAQAVRDTIVALAEKGLHEYFDPRTGAALGAGGFSFSAAVVLDLMQTKGKPAF